MLGAPTLQGAGATAGARHLLQGAYCKGAVDLDPGFFFFLHPPPGCPDRPAVLSPLTEMRPLALLSSWGRKEEEEKVGRKEREGGGRC